MTLELHERWTMADFGDQMADPSHYSLKAIAVDDNQYYGTSKLTLTFFQPMFCEVNGTFGCIFIAREQPITT